MMMRREHLAHLIAALTAFLCLASAAMLAGATPATAAPSQDAPGAWKRYNVLLERGSWQTVARRSIAEGSSWTVTTQLVLDLDSATGNEIRGRNTSIRWARDGWGQQSSSGSADTTGTTDNAIAVDNDATYQHLAQHTLAGGGPLDYQVKIGGSGRVRATLLVFKALRGTPAVSCPTLIPACMALDLAGDAVDAVTGAAGGMVESAAEAMLGVVATGFLEAYLIVFRYATSWWLDLDLSPTALVGAVDSGFRGTIAYIAMLIMVIALLSAAIQTMWRRDGAVVADTAAGLFKAGLVIGGAWGVIGVLWTLSDQLTAALAPNPDNIDVDPVLGLGSIMAGPGLAVLVIVVSLVGLVVSIGMALLMVFRLASATILALLLPIAAAGAPGTSTRAWLPKVVGWLLALIFLRPMIAAIYRIGFEFVAGGNDPANAALIEQMGSAGAQGLPEAAADGFMTLLVGVMTLLVAVFALPVLLRLTSWMFGSSAGLGGSGLAMASLAGHATLLRGRGGGGAGAQAQRITDGLGGPSGGGSAGGGGAAPGGIPGASGPAGGGMPGAPGAGGAGAAGTGGAAGAAGAGGAAAGGAAAGGAAAGGAAAAGAAGGPPGIAVAAVATGVVKVGQAVSAAGQKAGAIGEEATR
jgi:hypothetical protein